MSFLKWFQAFSSQIVLPLIEKALHNPIVCRLGNTDLARCETPQSVRMFLPRWKDDNLAIVLEVGGAALERDRCILLNQFCFHLVKYHLLRSRHVSRGHAAWGKVISPFAVILFPSSLSNIHAGQYCSPFGSMLWRLLLLGHRRCWRRLHVWGFT